jgi:hypothetical protein
MLKNSVASDTVVRAILCLLHSRMRSRRSNPKSTSSSGNQELRVVVFKIVLNAALSTEALGASKHLALGSLPFTVYFSNSPGWIPGAARISGYEPSMRNGRIIPHLLNSGLWSAVSTSMKNADVDSKVPSQPYPIRSTR